jgi:serralysin
VQRAIAAFSGVILSLTVPLTAWAADDGSSTTCFGQAATIVGTEGDDVLRGTDGADVISGLGGTDIIDGLGGADLLCGGDNPLVIRPPQQLPSDPEWPVLEVLRGGDGNDRIDGGLGFDSIKGGSGDDWVSVGASQPWPVAENPAGQLAVGGAGEDVLRADGGRAFFYGKYGDDRVLGGRFADWLVGGPGNDVVIGYGGSDTLHGRGGADDLYGFTGDDRLLGGDGRDENFGGTGSDSCESPNSGTDAHSCERRL